MSKNNLKQIVTNLIDTFLTAGKISLELREKGLIKTIKSDNTPVRNGDLEVNKIIITNITDLTADIPIVSEENSDNKSLNDLKNLLISQIESRVRWRETINTMIYENCHNFVEIGPGRVLSGMIKRIAKDLNVSSISSVDDLKNFKSL